MKRVFFICWIRNFFSLHDLRADPKFIQRRLLSWNEYLHSFHAEDMTNTNPSDLMMPEEEDLIFKILNNEKLKARDLIVLRAT